MSRILPIWTTVGFTGHRKLDDPQRVADAIGTALDELASAYGPLAAASSAASGADTLFIEDVARRRMPYFLILPFAMEQFRNDFTAEQWDGVSRHFEGAISIDVVHDIDSPQEGYLESGVCTVDQADVVLAVWDGRPAAGLGGTGDIVEYARALNKPVIRIDPASGAITKERMDRLPEPEAQPAVDPELPLRDLVARQYAEFDKIAEQYAPTSRRLIVRIIWLHLAATAIGITGAALSNPSFTVGQTFTAAKLAALSAALYVSSRQRVAHHEWRGARLGAEICRSFLAIWPLRRRGGRLPNLVSDDQAAMHRSLEMTWRLDRGAERPLDEARDAYLAGRVHDQLEYFHRKYKADGQRATRLKSLSLVATIAAIACGSLAFGMTWGQVTGPVYTMTKWFSNVLALIPPAVLTLVMGLDLSRRAERFSDATARLENAERRLLLARTWPSVWREVAETEGFLMREVVEWYSQTRPRKGR